MVGGPTWGVHQDWTGEIYVWKPLGTAVWSAAIVLVAALGLMGVSTTKEKRGTLIRLGQKQLTFGKPLGADVQSVATVLVVVLGLVGVSTTNEKRGMTVFERDRSFVGGHLERVLSALRSYWWLCFDCRPLSRNGNGAPGWGVATALVVVLGLVGGSTTNEKRGSRPPWGWRM